MFKNILRDLRSDENLSVMQLSKETKISPFKLAGYELGLILPKDTDELEPLANFFNVSVNLLLGIDCNPNTEVVEGNDLPQALRDHGITQMSVNRGYKMSDEKAEMLVEWLNKQNIGKSE